MTPRLAGNLSRWLAETAHLAEGFSLDSELAVSMSGWNVSVTEVQPVDCVMEGSRITRLLELGTAADRLVGTSNETYVSTSRFWAALAGDQIMFAASDRSAVDAFVLGMLVYARVDRDGQFDAT